MYDANHQEDNQQPSDKTPLPPWQGGSDANGGAAGEWMSRSSRRDLVSMGRPSQFPVPPANAYFGSKLAETKQEQRRVCP
jgi:hypothetical protein